jgi:hypothetical protein
MRIKRRARKNKVTLEIKSTTTAAESDPYSMFLFAMRSPKTREKCTGRLRMFFDFLDILPGQTMEERSMAFCEKAKSDNRWAFSSISSEIKGKSGDEGNNSRNHEEPLSGCQIIL